MKLDSRHIILQKIAAFSDKRVVNATFENEDARIYKPIEGSLDSCFQAELALIGGESFSFKTDVELYACLNSFMFVSDESVNLAGFNATITTGEVIGDNGGENCSNALDISAGGKFQANTFLSTGDPRNTDPNLCITSCLAGVGTQPIT